MEAENIKKLPKVPGIYIFKDIDNNIIYIGKAKNIYKRVSSYFTKTDDWKVIELIKEHDKVEHIITKSELEALLLEAQLISKFKPKYNVLLKGNAPFIYIVITNSSDKGLPEIVTTKCKILRVLFMDLFCIKQKLEWFVNIY